MLPPFAAFVPYGAPPPRLNSPPCIPLRHRIPICRVTQPHVVIIGGGAAGFFAAITLARAAGQAASLTILEATPSVLQKVRISGGGRCNVTSALHHDDPVAFAANYPRGARAMPAVLARYGPADVIRFFERESVPLKAEPSGKLFPVSDSSETVIAALVAAARRAGVTICTTTRVDGLTLRPGGGFDISVVKRDVIEATFVVVATGSALKPQRWAERLGHVVIPPVPSLFTFRVADELLCALAGVAVDDCCLSLELPKGTAEQKRKRGRRESGLVQRGPLLFTHWGLSGPAVLTLSAFGARLLHEHKYQMSCSVDWVPIFSLDEKVAQLRAAKFSLGPKNITTVGPFQGKIPNRLWRYFVQTIPGLSSSQKWSSLRNDHLSKLAEKLHCSRFLIGGKGEFKDEFVTAGGVDLKSISTKTFESKHCTGLYFAGEALDVDGRTGGYNLEFAWSSGHIVGASIGERVLQLANRTAVP